MFTIIMIVFFFFSCKNESDIKELKDGFVTEAGKYYIGNNEFELFQVVNGSLIFAMQDSAKSLLFQRGIGNPFSSFQKWVLFFDNKNNLWFYNSDYAETYVWIKEKDGEYTCHDFCKENLPLPTEFINYIDPKMNNICLENN